MIDRIKEFLKESPDNADRIVLVSNNILLDMYPNLQLRWSKIYGKRWSHFHGNSGEPAHNPLQLKLNKKYGLCIDNAEIIPADELDKVIKMIKECFADENYV